MGTARDLEETAGVRRGRRLTVTLTGKYAGAVNDRTPGFYLACASGEVVFIPDASYPTVDLQPEPDPAWWPPQAGDVIAIGGHAQWMRRHILGDCVWVTARNTSTIGDDDVLAAHRRSGDVTLLVRDGKPVR